MDTERERVINSVNKHFVQNIEETLRMQALNRTRGKRSLNNDEDPVENRRIRPDSNGFSNETNNVDNQDTDNNIQEIELIIKPLPQVERRDPSLNQTRFMKTTTKATINHIAKYLKMRYNFESSEDDCTRNNNDNDDDNDNDVVDNKDTNSSSAFPFTLYIAAGPGQYNPLQGSITLAQVDEQYWKINKPLELFYAYKVNPTS
uniref:RING-type E3 ubiquitin transferase n=1 Tax=Dermatophagoides pteronyssinus TaxID=6956 RepID=A0A6P6XUV8_DERPT|nr:E3 ubiquitin-protein ligase RING2-like [Dermatophagoides pteronyssinus]